MTVSPAFIQYTLDQLADFGRVTARRMFGGVGLYAHARFFALISDDTLYFKVDDSNRAAYLERGLKPFQPMPDRSSFTMSYYPVPPDVLEDSEQLAQWARAALAIANPPRRKAQARGELGAPPARRRRRAVRRR